MQRALPYSVLEKLSAGGGGRAAAEHMCVTVLAAELAGLPALTTGSEDTDAVMAFLTSLIDVIVRAPRCCCALPLCCCAAALHGCLAVLLWLLGRS